MRPKRSPDKVSAARRRTASVWQDAVQRLVGGVDSPVRAFRHVGGDPIVLASSRGATVRDVDGREYVDLIMGWGPLILGHQPAPVTRALARQLRRGCLFGLTHEGEVELAGLITEAVPSVEAVRFTTSGSEAAMTAIRLARAATGRPKIVMFEGGYHGHSDSLMAGSTAGVSEPVSRDTIRVPYNDLDALVRALDQHGEAVACVIAEPVPGNMGVISPEPGFLSHLRGLTQERGILLILDEVITGFRLAYGAAQSLAGVRADLTVFGKIIGGGLPIGALGGPRRLMQRLAPEGDVFHGGTFAGHPLTMAAGAAALKALKASHIYKRLESASAALAGRLQDAARDAGVPIHINRHGSMFTVFFTKGPVRRLADVAASDRDAFKRWANRLRQAGVLWPPSPYEAAFWSAAHTASDVSAVARAARMAFAAERA